MSRTADPSAAKQEPRDEDVTASRFREERRSRKASDDVASDAPTTASSTSTSTTTAAAAAAAAAASSSATPPTTLVPRFKADVTIFASSPLPTSSETRRPSGISSAGEEQEGAKDAGPPRSSAFVNEKTPVFKEKVQDSESSRVAKEPEFKTDVAKSSETGADAISKALKNSGERDKDGDSHVQRVRLKGPSGPIQLSIDPEKGTITVGASRLGMNCGAAENSAKDAPVQLSMSISGDKAGTIEASIPKSAMSLTEPRTLGAPKPQKVGSVDAEAAKALREQLHVKRSDGSDGAVGIKFGRTQSNALEDRRKDVGGLGVNKNLQEATGIFKQSLQRGKPASDASSDYSVIDNSARSDDRDLKNSKKDAVNINSIIDGSHEGISNDVMNIQIGVSPARRKSVQTTNDVTGSWKLLGESAANLPSRRDSILSTLLPNMPEQASSNMDLEVMNNGAIGSDTSINDASARRVIDRSSTEQWATRIVSSVMASGAPSNDMLEGKSLFVPVIGGRNIAPNEAFAFVDEKAAEDNEVQTIPTARACGMSEVSETGRERLHASSTGEPPDSLANTNTKITSVAPTERIKIRREDSSGQPRATEKSSVDFSEASGNEKAGSPAEEGSVTLGGAGSALNVHMGDSPDPSQQLSLRQKAHQLLGHIFPQGGGDDDDDAADEDAGGGGGRAEDASGTGSGGGDAVGGAQQLPARKEGGVGGGDVVAASGELRKQLVKPGQRLPISETCNDEDTKMTRERKRVYYHHQEISNAAKEAHRRRPIAKRADGTEDDDVPGSGDGGEIVPAARIDGATGFKPGARMKYKAETRSETDTGDASGSEMNSLTGNGISSSGGTGAESRCDSGSASEGDAEPRAESSASEGTASLVESEDSDAGSAPPKEAAATRHRKQPRRDDLRDSVRDNPLDMVEARAEQRVLPRAVGDDAGEGERARGMEDFTGANNLAEHVYPAVGDVDTSVFSREAGGADARPARGGGRGPLGGDFPAENSATGEVNPGSGVEALKSGAVAEIQENSLVQDPLAGADVLHFRAVSAAQWPLPSLPPPPPPSPPEQSAHARPPAPQPLKQLFSVVTLEPPADEGLSDTDQAQAQAEAQAQAPAVQQGRAPQGSESGAGTPTRSPPPPPPPPPPAAPVAHKGPAASPPQRPQSAKKWRRPPGGARPSHSSPPSPQTSSPPPPPPPTARPIPTVSKPAAGSTAHAAAAAARTRPPAQATSTAVAAAAATHPSGRLAVIASSTARPAPAPAALKSSAGGGDAAAGEPCGGRASSPGFRSGPPAAGAARAAGVLRPTGTRGGDDDRKGSRHRARMPGRRGGGHLGRSAGEAEAVVGGAPAAALAQLDAQPQAQPPPQGPGGSGSGGEGESEGDGRWRHLNELLRNELWTGDLDGAPHNVRLMKIGRAKSDAGAVTSSSASKPPDAKFRTPPNILNALQAMGATASAAAEIAAANQDADAGDESPPPPPPPPPSSSTTAATDALEDVMDRLIEDVADRLVASTNRHASEATRSTRAPAPGVWGAGAAAGGGGEDWSTAPAAVEPDEAAEAGDVNGMRGAGGAAARAPGGGLGVGVGAGSRPGGVESSASAGGAERPGGAANEEPEDSEASAADGGESGFEAPAQSSPASPLRAPRPLRRKHHPRAGDGAAGAPQRARAAGAGELATVAGAGKDAGLAEGRRAAKREESELEQNTQSASDQPEDSGLARLESLAAADALPATALPGAGAGARLQEIRDNERRPQGGGGFSGRRVYRRLATGTPERVAPYPAAGVGRGVASGADSHANDDSRRLKGGDAPTAKRSLASSGVAHGWARDAARGDEGEGEASETAEREAGGGGGDGGGGGEEERLHRGGGLTAERSLSERMGHGCHGWHGRRHTLPSRCPPCPSAAPAAPAAPTTPAACAPSTCACCPGGCPAHSTAHAPAQPRTGTRCSNHPAPSSSLGPAHTPSPRSHPPQT